MTIPAEHLIDRLAAHRTLGAVPRADLTWLASRGTLRQIHPGQVLTRKGTPPEGLFVVLSGSFTMSVDSDAGPRKIMEWRDGDVMGLLPYSPIAGPPGDAVAQEPSEILQVNGDDIRELTEKCYDLTATLVHVMIDRARAFASSDLHDEKMVSLGKLSAGLAHELNNPTAAIERSAALLEERLADSERATRALGAFRLTAAQLAAVDDVRAACLAKQETGVRSPIQQAEREEAMADWLAGRSLDMSIAEPLADTAVQFEALHRLSDAIDGPALNAVLRWAASECAVRSLACEIQDAATRISGLVVAIKGFTHMDRAAVAGPVDLMQGLRNTATVLRAKARAKSATVAVEAEPDLPRARGFAGELNQIWANLIDNALDAIPERGHIEVKASRDGGRVVVRVIDNGAGIPAQICDLIFDPFFTTKPMGQGTGLGLDIVRRLVRHNDGELSVESRPGRTEFRVSLRVAQIDATEHRE
jgi:signal transduction histidine kinase